MSSFYLQRQSRVEKPTPAVILRVSEESRLKCDVRFFAYAQNDSGALRMTANQGLNLSYVEIL